MHAPHLSAVIIDDRHGGLFHFLHGHLFHYFAPHPIPVAQVLREESMILLRDVPSDADGVQSTQPSLLAALPSAAWQYLAIANQQNVGYELFVAFILFGLRPV